MSPLSDSNLTDAFDQEYAVLKGGTDNTTIGNIGDRLKVDSIALPSSNELATFTVYVSAAGVASNKSMVSLVNASGSTVKIKIREIKLINVQNTAVTGVILDFEYRRITNHSAGTLVTPNSHDTTDTLNGSVTARTGATVTGEAAILYRYKWSSDDWGVGAQDVESNTHVLASLLPSYSPAQYTKPITLNANEGFHIKQTVASTIGSFDMFITFTQE